MDDLHEWKNRIYATKHEILSIIGKLQFCARVIHDGFKFISRLINISKRVRSLHHRIYITSEAHADLRWWEECMECHYGIAFFPEPWCMDKDQIVFSDASDIGLGIVCDNSWSILQFTGRYEYLKHTTIAYRECVAIVLLLCVFG